MTTAVNDPSRKRGTVRIYKAIQEDGSVLWPEERPIEWLDQVKATKPEPYFNSQYQNDPSGLSGVLFSTEWLQFYTSVPDLTEMRGMMGADPATSESKEANYFGVCIGGRARDGVVYVLGFPYAQIEAPKHENFLRTSFKLWQKRGLRIHKVRKESHGPIQAATQHLEKSNRMADSPMPLEIVKPKGSKEERFRELVPHISNGTILFPGVRGPDGEVRLDTSNPGFKEFQNEWSGYPIARRDDLLDALWVMADGLLGMSPAAGFSEEGYKRKKAEQMEQMEESETEAVNKQPPPPPSKEFWEQEERAPRPSPNQHGGQRQSLGRFSQLTRLSRYR